MKDSIWIQAFSTLIELIISVVMLATAGGVWISVGWMIVSLIHREPMGDSWKWFLVCSVTYYLLIERTRLDVGIIEQDKVLAKEFKQRALQKERDWKRYRDITRR
jgi:hypothetical protein